MHGLLGVMQRSQGFPRRRRRRRRNSDAPSPESNEVKPEIEWSDSVFSFSIVRAVNFSLQGVGSSARKGKGVVALEFKP